MYQKNSSSNVLNKKILFVFGAGASKGSEREVAKQPPLGKDLHSFCAKTSKAWQKVIENKNLLSVMADPEKGFEQGMVALHLIDPELFWECHNDMNRILFQFEPSKDNLYGIFFNQLKAVGQLQDIKIATLNYDRLLPLSLAAQGILPYTIAPNGDCISLVTEISNFEAAVEIIMPHGASFIFADKTPLGPIQPPKNCPTEQQTEWIINYSSQKILNTPIRVIHDESSFLQQLKDYNLPAVSYIVPEKDIVGEGATYVKFQELKRIKEIATLVDQIFVIGVNYQSHDKFWEGIRQSKAFNKIQFRGNPIPLFHKKYTRFDYENYQDILKHVIVA